MRSRRARVTVSRIIDSSGLRPTSGASGGPSYAAGCSKRARSASYTGTGSVFPFACSIRRSPYSIAPCVARYVDSPTSTESVSATSSMRNVVVTTSPVAIPSPAPDDAPSCTTASPVFTPTRTPRTESRIASAARTARSASSSCVVGAPKTAITASPTNFSKVPPWCSSAARIRERCGLTAARRSSGSRPSPSAVESTRSAKSTVTTLRSSPIRASTAVPQAGQKRALSGSSEPHWRHAAMLRG